MASPALPAGDALAAPPLHVRLPALAELLRPGNAAMTALGVAVGAYVQAGAAVQGLGLPIALAALAGFAFAGAGNALNDYLDRATDQAAHPARPLPSGRALPRDALRLQAALFALAVVAATLVGIAAGVFVVAAMALMVGYEVRLKAQGLPGNLAIGVLTGAPFVFGALATGAVGAGVLALAVLAVLATLGREIIKDVEDMAGDVGRRTLPMRIGAAPATRVAQGALVVGVLLSPAPLLAGAPFGWAYLPLVALADVALLAAAFLATGSPTRGQRGAKAGMLLALVAFAAGRFTA
jgi:geranylgeranylglycerol-phosphate geranylgeranyltransferase